MFIQFGGLVQRTPALDADVLKQKIKEFMQKHFCMYNFTLKADHEEPAPGYGSAVRIFGTIECSELALDADEVESKLKGLIVEDELLKLTSGDVSANFAIQFYAKQIAPPVVDASKEPGTIITA